MALARRALSEQTWCEAQPVNGARSSQGVGFLAVGQETNSAAWHPSTCKAGHQMSAVLADPHGWSPTDADCIDELEPATAAMLPCCVLPECCLAAGGVSCCWGRLNNHWEDGVEGSGKLAARCLLSIAAG